MIALIKKFLNWLFPKKDQSYYVINEQTNEPEKVVDSPSDQVKYAPEEFNDDMVPLFTVEELNAMKKDELYDLASDSGIPDVAKKDTKKVLIKKITSHYELE